MTTVKPGPDDLDDEEVIEVRIQPEHHLHYLEQQNGSVRVHSCTKTDCGKTTPLLGTMAEIFASVKR